MSQALGAMRTGPFRNSWFSSFTRGWEPRFLSIVSEYSVPGPQMPAFLSTIPGGPITILFKWFHLFSCVTLHPVHCWLINSELSLNLRLQLLDEHKWIPQVTQTRHYKLNLPLFPHQMDYSSHNLINSTTVCRPASSSLGYSRPPLSFLLLLNNQALFVSHLGKITQSAPLCLIAPAPISSSLSSESRQLSRGLLKASVFPFCLLKTSL